MHESKSEMLGPKKKLGGTAKTLSPAAHKRQTAMYEAGKRKRPPQKPVAGAKPKYGDLSIGIPGKPPRSMKPVKPPIRPGIDFPSDRPRPFPGMPGPKPPPGLSRAPGLLKPSRGTPKPKRKTA